MKTASIGIATALLLACTPLSGCVRTRVHGETPALLGTDADSRAALQKVVDTAMGRSVALASDALTRDNTLLIEPVPPMADGQRVDGRETRPPVRFTLLLSDGDCVLVHEGGKRAQLRGAHCQPR